MGNVDILLNIFTSSREIGNEVIAKEAITAIAVEYGVAAPVRYNSIQDIRLYTPLLPSNRITAIKELRERAMENGMTCGLKEAKDEIDYRVAEQRRKEEQIREEEWRRY